MGEIYRWVEDIAFYSILLVLVMHVLPAGDQKKYVRFFMGLLFMLLVFGPILRWTNQEEQVTNLFLRAGYEQELEEFLQERRRLERNMETYTQELLQETVDRARQEAEARDKENGEWKDGESGREETGRRQGGSDQAGGEGGEGSGENLVEPVEIHVGEDTKKGT
ncbi:MAG: stage III sporulation protein AF [Lachnospiraceae bacterium]|nr:stage III sporulation protein AF [Lachnospiraceae bacterium]